MRKYARMFRDALGAQKSIAIDASELTGIAFERKPSADIGENIPEPRAGPRTFVGRARGRDLARCRVDVARTVACTRVGVRTWAYVCFNMDMPRVDRRSRA